MDLAERPDLDDAVHRLLQDVPVVLVTLGAQGARLLRRNASEVHVAAPRVMASDTVAAGDTFCGVYAAGRARGIDERASLERACAAASLAVQRPGAQASIPTAEQVDAQLREVYESGPSRR